jgi:hypothetical protein
MLKSSQPRSLLFLHRAHNVSNTFSFDCAAADSAIPFANWQNSAIIGVVKLVIPGVSSLRLYKGVCVYANHSS